MKRTALILAALMAAVLLLSAPQAWAESGELRPYDASAGYTYVTLGRYPQTADGGVLPILWRVLTADEERIYLCSEYILFARPMHPDLREYRDVLHGDFGQTELCRYLNTDFAAEAFTEAELEMLLPFENFGRIFLLDAAEVSDRDLGMGRETNIRRSPGLRAWGTEYAIANGLYVFQAKYGRHSPYWVRNQSTTDGRHARCTKDGGQLGHIEVGRANEGVRPAVYLDRTAFAIAGGSGSMEDPYALVPVAAPEAEPLPAEEEPGGLVDLIETEDNP